MHGERWHSGCIHGVDIEARDACIFRRCCAKASWRDGDVVAEIAKSEIGQECRTDRIIKTASNTVIVYVGVTCEAAYRRSGRQCCTTHKGSKEPWSGAQILLIAVPPEDLHLAGRRVIGSNVEPIRIQDVATRAKVVIVQRVCRRCVWPRNQLQEILCLWGQTACGDYVTRK